MNRTLLALSALVLVVGQGIAAGNPPGVTLSLSGPAEFEVGVPVTFSGRFEAGNAVGLPLQVIELLVDGVPSASTQTALDGSYAANITFPGSPMSRTVQAFAHRGTPIESASNPVVITLRPRLVSISVAPSNATITAGQGLQYTATGTYNTGAVGDVTGIADWSSSNTMVATVGNSAGNKGRATGVGSGSTTITATSDAVSGATTLNVTSSPTLLSITIAPTNATVTVGGSLQYTATAHYSDMSSQDVTTAATWSSANPMIVSISNNMGSRGLATGQSAGSTTITADYQMRQASTSVTAVQSAGIHVVINEVDYDQPGTDVDEFIEIYNPSSSTASLDNIAVILVNGSNSTEYARVNLMGTIPAGGYAVVKSPTVFVPMGVPTFPFAASSNAIQNGAPDGVALFNTATNTLIDALSYEGSITAAIFTGVMGTFNLVEGTATMAQDVDSPTGSMSRSPNGTDTDNAAADWAFANPTPGATNA